MYIVVSQDSDNSVSSKVVASRELAFKVYEQLKQKAMGDNPHGFEVTERLYDLKNLPSISIRIDHYCLNIGVFAI